jgi:hypothetical protein
MSRFTILFALCAVVGCGKKDGGGGDKPAATKLPKLGLQLDLPGDVNVSDPIMADVGNSITGEAVGSMQVETFKAPKTLDEEKADAKDYSPKNVKADTLPDGWALSFENTGSMGTNYWVTVRRDIGGKSYKCWTTGSKAEQAQAVLAACKTLRP